MVSELAVRRAVLSVVVLLVTMVGVEDQNSCTGVLCLFLEFERVGGVVGSVVVICSIVDRLRIRVQ